MADIFCEFLKREDVKDDLMKIFDYVSNDFEQIKKYHDETEACYNCKHYEVGPSKEPCLSCKYAWVSVGKIDNEINNFERK